MGGVMLKKFKKIQGVVLLVFITTMKLNSQALIVDHEAVLLFDMIPDIYLEKAKELTIHYGHTSHGSQIIAGLNYLESMIDYVKYNVEINDRTPDRTPNLPAEVNPPALRMWEEGLWPYTDESLGRLGYWDGQAAQEGTMEVLNSGLFDVSGWAWCGQVATSDSFYIESYLETLKMFEMQFPDIKFIYMTGHNVEPGPPPYQQIEYDRLHANNNKIREFCQVNNKILYDFADIEAWDLNGTYYPEEDASCVWCDEWCNDHPEDCIDLPSESNSGGGANCTTCAHTHGLNCIIKAKAFWYMMARLAGWDGQITVPVELLNFEGLIIECGIKLSWNTASERNNYGFKIFRSEANENNFKEIDFVAGNGTTETHKEYYYIDKLKTKGTYYYQLEQIDFNKTSNILGTIRISTLPTMDANLFQNYPNPFNASTAVGYSIPTNCHVELKIYDLNSRVINELVNENQNQGSYNIIWNAENIPSGQYFYSLKVGDYQVTKRMSLIK